MSTLDMVHGPAPVDREATRRWLRGECGGPVPVRQGFAAVLTEDDGSVVAATSSRLEIALYYVVDGGRLRWSPTLAGLVGQLARPPALDVTKLADLMALHDAADRTVLVGVRRLPVGHLLTWRPGQDQPRVRRWFRPSTLEDRSIRLADAPRLMRDAVADAVAASLPPAGDVAATLSGGLDSAMVVATASSLLRGTGRTVHTVTHVPLPGTPDPAPGWEADDGPYARRMAQEVPGLTWRPLVHEARTTPLETVADLLPHTWSPVFNPANVVWLTAAVEHARRLGSPVLLTGATGNAPYSRDRAGLVRQLVLRGRLHRLPAEVLRRRRAGTPLSGAARAVALEAISPRTRTVLRRLRGRTAAPGEEPFEAVMPLRVEALSGEAVDQLHRIDDGEPLSQQEWVDFVLRDGSLATEPLVPGVWWSDPLSDPEVEALALRLPLEAWLLGGTDRGLARLASDGLVPDHIRLRTTRGAQAADAGAWLAGHEQEYRDLLDRLRCSPTAPQFIDLDRVAAAVDAGLPSGAAALRWEETYGRALGLGLFAVWYEDEVLGRQ